VEEAAGGEEEEEEERAEGDEAVGLLFEGEAEAEAGDLVLLAPPCEEEGTDAAAPPLAAATESCKSLSALRRDTLRRLCPVLGGESRSRSGALQKNKERKPQMSEHAASKKTGGKKEELQKNARGISSAFGINGLATRPRRLSPSPESERYTTSEDEPTRHANRS
jgi:hypothetical protein